MMTATTLTYTLEPSSRRPLRVSNGYIDIDNIRDPPGEDFETWIEITKEKLKERESKLMSARISALQNIIKEQCAAFESAHCSLQFGGRSVRVSDQDRVLHSGVIEECLNKLSLSLQLWHGVNLSKTKKTLNTFREYFVIGKCWFDQKKKSILAPDFWIKILCVLDQFADDTAAAFFQERCPRVQRLFCQHLRFQMVSGIFAGQLHFAETKPQPLIPCSIIKDSRSMKEYLLRLHSTLNVDRMMKENKPSDPKAKSITAMKVLDLVNKQLADLRDSFHVDFQRAFQALPRSLRHAPPPSRVTITPSSVPPLPTLGRSTLSSSVPLPFQSATSYPVNTVSNTTPSMPHWQVQGTSLPSHSANTVKPEPMQYCLPPPILPNLTQSSCGSEPIGNSSISPHCSNSSDPHSSDPHSSHRVSSPPSPSTTSTVVDNDSSNSSNSSNPSNKTSTQSTLSALPSFETCLNNLSTSFENSARNSFYNRPTASHSVSTGSSSSASSYSVSHGGTYGTGSYGTGSYGTGSYGTGSYGTGTLGYGGIHDSAHSVMASRFNPMASWNDSNTVISGGGVSHNGMSQNGISHNGLPHNGLSGLLASPMMAGMNGMNGMNGMDGMSGYSHSNYNDTSSVYGGGDYGSQWMNASMNHSMNPSLNSPAAPAQFVHNNGIDGGHVGHSSDSQHAHGSSTQSVESSAPHSSAHYSSACQTSAHQTGAPDQQNTNCCCYCAHCVQHGGRHDAQHGVPHGHGAQHSATTNSNQQ